MAGLFLLKREADFIPACCICTHRIPLCLVSDERGQSRVGMFRACSGVPARLRELLQVVCLVRLGGFRRWSIGPN